MADPLRDRLAEALADELARHRDEITSEGEYGRAVFLVGCTCGWQQGSYSEQEMAAYLRERVTAQRRHAADALLPVVRAFAAEQLRTAADRIDGSRRWDTQIARDLRERADQLDGGAA